MKKQLFAAIMAVLTVFVVSCSTTTPPISPADGGTYLVEEVYSLIGLTPDEAKTQLEGRGYNLSMFSSENGLYVYSFSSDEVEYDIYMYAEDDVIVVAEGETDLKLSDLRLWGPWVTNKLSYNLWLGYLNDDFYTDGVYFDVIKAELIKEFDEEYGDYLTEEQYNTYLDLVIRETLGGTKEEYTSALSEVSYSKNLYVAEFYAQFNKNYEGTVVELMIDAEEKTMYCYVEQGDLSDYLDFDYYVEAKPNFTPAKRKLFHVK